MGDGIHQPTRGSSGIIIPGRRGGTGNAFKNTLAADVQYRLGGAYAKELTQLLNPRNGRMDIVGGGNRYPMRGTASVYPVYPSVFYAYNYESYPIDLIILAQESGHAVQASLMKIYNVPMLYGAGPGYFTESFRKFNELVLFDYLSETEKDEAKKAFYRSPLKERIQVLYSSAEEADVEYSLITNILSENITSPNDLDSVTYVAGSAISPRLYKKEKERKYVWLVLETDFYDPLHNINDMLGAALAVSYYKRYKENRTAFITAYQKLMSEGYHDAPDVLLKKLDIDIANDRFMEETLSVIKNFH